MSQVVLQYSTFYAQVGAIEITSHAPRMFGQQPADAPNAHARSNPAAMRSLARALSSQRSCASPLRTSMTVPLGGAFADLRGHHQLASRPCLDGALLRKRSCRRAALAEGSSVLVKVRWLAAHWQCTLHAGDTPLGQADDGRLHQRRSWSLPYYSQLASRSQPPSMA